MVESKSGVSFDEIIQADRQRKKNEALANEIFGRNKSNKNSGGNARNSPRPQVLATRGGIAKRSSSTTSTGSHSGSPFSPPSRPSSAVAQRARVNRFASAVNSQTATFSDTKAPGPGISIKGKAGPIIVEGSNFAPGTTAEDIESSLASETVDSQGKNGLLSCRIVVKSPTVIAEMIFSERQVADRIVSLYNNQRADGRILHLYLKQSFPGAEVIRSRNGKAEPPSAKTTASMINSREILQENNEEEMEDIEMGTEPVIDFEASMEASNRDPRDGDTRRTEPNLQDGKYGFKDTKPSNEPRLSDTTVKAKDGEQQRDRNQNRSREHESDRDRDRDRDRRYEDNRYDRRNDREGYRRDERPNDYNNTNTNTQHRGTRPTHYGNGAGMGGGGRGSYNGPPPPSSSSRGGRMYSDDMMRGGRGMGPRGGYRGYR